MTKEQKKEILKISKQFAKGLKIPLKGSEFFIVAPLSSYLEFVGFKNHVTYVPGINESDMVAIINFDDKTKFIPAGSDIPIEGMTDWMFIDPLNLTLRE